jgi:hypothetical protein
LPTIPKISAKQATTSHLKSLFLKKTNTTTYGVTNPGAGLGQDKNRWVKLIY